MSRASHPATTDPLTHVLLPTTQGSSRAHTTPSQASRSPGASSASSIEGEEPIIPPNPAATPRHIHGMKITTPQITWHGGEAGKNDPVLSADVHPCGVLATGGADAEVRVRP